MLIERAQFAYNPLIYKPGAFKEDLAWDGTWLEWFLLEIESFHGMSNIYSVDKFSRPTGEKRYTSANATAKARRYTRLVPNWPNPQDTLSRTTVSGPARASINSLTSRIMIRP